MIKKIKIGKDLIGNNSKTYVITEIGSNHNNDLKKAYKMIDIAKKCGSNAVKFQIFREKRLYVPNAGRVDYLKLKKTINEIVIENEAPLSFHKKLFEYCKKKKITYLCTPTDETLADYLDNIGVQAFKIASYASTHLPLIKHIAKKGKPIILSTGSTSLYEIHEAVETILSQNNQKIIILHCVSKYPAKLNECNLNIITKLKKQFNFPIGLSDHSLDPVVAPVTSVVLGAKVIEKHFTLNKKDYGPDQKFSVDPVELKIMINAIRGAEKSLGTDIKKVFNFEKELRDFAHRSIFSIKSIKKGEKFSKSNIAVLRPGKKKKVLMPKYYDIVLGAKSLNNIDAGKAIKLNDFILYGKKN